MAGQILYQTHPAMFRNKPVQFILSLLLIPVFGIGLLILLLWWVKVLGTTLIVTDQSVTLRTGILSKYTNEVYHSDVRNVQVYQDLLQRIFNVGALAISSAGQGGVEIAVAGIPQPEHVKAIIDRYRRAGA